LRFDYSGHGESAGRFEDGTIGAWLAEAERVASLASTASRVVFVGSSMGAWIALLLARRQPAASIGKPAGVVLIAPAWNMTRLMHERAPEEARVALDRDGFYLRPSAYDGGAYVITKALIDSGERHLLTAAPTAYDGPVRILHGCRDQDIPWRHSLALLDLLGGGDVRLTLVKDGEHRLSRPQDLALLFSMLEEFLDPSLGRQ
jgi:pimeloyl-ACP methyl ester carboxylesterase